MVASAANLECGLKAANGSEFEIGVLDINLHGVQSYPIAEVLEGRGIPFVFVSGYTGAGVDARFTNVPKLQKPFTAKALGEVPLRVRLSA